jgi:hypothetical protein
VPVETRSLGFARDDGYIELSAIGSKEDHVKTYQHFIGGQYVDPMAEGSPANPFVMR